MTTLEQSQMIGKPIELFDTRTGRYYTAVVQDVRSDFGRIRVKVQDADRWFEPSTREMESMK